jgi:hypothetical protein
LVTAPDGTRLGKRAGAASLAALRARGISDTEIIGWLGWSLGCLPHPGACQVTDLLAAFAWDKVPTGGVAIPAAWV